jgi:hypothetical protein
VRRIRVSSLPRRDTAEPQREPRASGESTLAQAAVVARRALRSATDAAALARRRAPRCADSPQSTRVRCRGTDTRPPSRPRSPRLVQDACRRTLLLPRPTTPRLVHIGRSRGGCYAATATGTSVADRSSFRGHSRTLAQARSGCSKRGSGWVGRRLHALRSVRSVVEPPANEGEPKASALRRHAQRR